MMKVGKQEDVMWKGEVGIGRGTHVGHVHNVNNVALRAADLIFVFWLLTPTHYSESW